MSPVRQPQIGKLKPIWEMPPPGSKMPLLETFRLTKEMVQERVKDNVIVATFGIYAFMDFILTWVKHLTDLGVENLLVAGGAYNIGIFHWRPTDSAKKLAKEWKEMLLADDKIWDQNGFNDLVHKQLGPSVEHNYLISSNFSLTTTREEKFRKRVKRYVGIWCCVDGHNPCHIYYDMYWDEKPDWKPLPPQTSADDLPDAAQHSLASAQCGLARLTHSLAWPLIRPNFSLVLPLVNEKRVNTMATSMYRDPSRYAKPRQENLNSPKSIAVRDDRSSSTIAIRGVFREPNDYFNHRATRYCFLAIRRVDPSLPRAVAEAAQVSFRGLEACEVVFEFNLV
ncbi:hypothetical protein E3N88_30822 [Mikania micrantha]|uniref:Nucleotide-diphospho-sugar transferase domain-containing protein n=1 Tax=Mikania micrantha TaxID=192012 RepID=A0A5N6MNA5_9ASTR|nr:hypothetical protein E3N88_30822 [Mikania micrantha]